MMETADSGCTVSARGERCASDRLIFILASICVVVAVLLATRLVLGTRTGTVDSYYYFARAADLNDGVPLASTTINWGPEQVDRKFFPGYAQFLHWFSFGSPPERAWKWLSILFVITDSILLGFALRRLGLSFFVSCAGVAMFASHPVPLRWMTMPMAEGAALFYLCLSAIVLPRKDDPIKFAYPRFLIACLLGGMSILCRAEASFVAGAIGCLGVARMFKKPGWWAASAAGAFLGILPFAYWVSSLPPAASGEASRLHYVNEFFEMFTLRDVDGDDGSRGGLIDNFARCWRHLSMFWGRVPFMRSELRENLYLLGASVVFVVSLMVIAVFGLAGKPAQRFALLFVGFVVFRSFWYYPYDRFLITGIPLAFAAIALIAEHLKSFGRLGRAGAVGLVIFFSLRSLVGFLEYHKFDRAAENGTHSYRDDIECRRIYYQLDYQWFPLDGEDMTILAARRFSRTFQQGRAAATNAQAESLRNEIVALEFPWPQICYGLRPRPIVLGYPLINFWGPAEYRRFENLPMGPGGKPSRPQRSAIEFLRDRGVRYVITPLPRSMSESMDDKDRNFGTWLESKGVAPSEVPGVALIDTSVERGDYRKEYEKPRRVRILELKYDKMTIVKNPEQGNPPADPPKKPG